MRKITLSITISAAMAVFLLAGGCGSKAVKSSDPYDPEKYIAKSDRLVGEKEYKEAREVLLEVKNRDTQKKYGAIAALKIADSYNKEGETDLAIAEYRKFIDTYPDNQYAPYAQYQIAMVHFQQIESPDIGAGAARLALEEFGKLKKMYPRNAYRDIVEVRMEKARNTLAEGDHMIAQFYFNKESYDATVTRIENLRKTYPSYKKMDEALLLLGKAYLNLKDKVKAKEALESLIKQYPASKYAKDAQKLTP